MRDRGVPGATLGESRAPSQPTWALACPGSRRRRDRQGDMGDELWPVDSPVSHNKPPLCRPHPAMCRCGATAVSKVASAPRAWARRRCCVCASPHLTTMGGAFCSGADGRDAEFVEMSSGPRRRVSEGSEAAGAGPAWLCPHGPVTSRQECLLHSEDTAPASWPVLLSLRGWTPGDTAAAPAPSWPAQEAQPLAELRRVGVPSASPSRG